MASSAPLRSRARASATHATAASCSGARDPSTGVDGKTIGSGSSGAESTSPNRPSPASTTNASRQPPSNTHSRIGRLSSSSLATMTPSIGSSGRSPRDSIVGGVQGPLGRRHVDGDVAHRRDARRLGGEDRPGQRARPGAGVDDGERVRAPEVDPPGVEVAGEHGAEQRTDLRRREERSTTPAGAPARLRSRTRRSRTGRGVGTRRTGSPRPPRRSPCGSRRRRQTRRSRASRPMATDPSGPASSASPAGTINDSIDAVSMAAT